MTYALVFLSILIRESNAIFEMFLEGRINNQLLTDRVSGKLPGKQILVLGLLGLIGRLRNAVVVRLNLAVILFNSVDDARRAHDG